MNKSGGNKGRSSQTKGNKIRVLTKQYNKLKKLQKSKTLQEWLKQVKEPNKSN